MLPLSSTFSTNWNHSFKNDNWNWGRWDFAPKRYAVEGGGVLAIRLWVSWSRNESSWNSVSLLDAQAVALKASPPSGVSIEEAAWAHQKDGHIVDTCGDRELFCRSLIWKPPPHFGKSVELHIYKLLGWNGLQFELCFLVRRLNKAIPFIEQTRKENCALKDRSLSPLWIFESLVLWWRRNSNLRPSIETLPGLNVSAIAVAYPNFYPPKWLVFFRLRWSNRFSGQDLRVPGYIKGYVRRFWQVCKPRTNWLLSPSSFPFPALSSLIGVEPVTIWRNRSSQPPNTSYLLSNFRDKSHRQGQSIDHTRSSYLVSRSALHSTHISSEDHRGTVEKPGRVVTLIERSFWDTLKDHDDSVRKPDLKCPSLLPNDRITSSLFPQLLLNWHTRRCSILHI